ncbi:hypothetical protein ACFPM0_25215 [Pseudonocardia sulfidoxydans]
MTRVGAAAPRDGYRRERRGRRPVRERHLELSRDQRGASSQRAVAWRPL